MTGGYGGVRLTLADLGEQVLTTGEDVNTIVLYKSGAETMRAPVRLDAQATSTVEL